MGNTECDTVLIYINQAVNILERESRGELYIERAVEDLKSIAFNLDQNYKIEYYSSAYENPYCQSDFV